MNISKNQNEVIISLKLAENIVVVTNTNDLSNYAQTGAERSHVGVRGLAFRLHIPGWKLLGKLN